MKGFKGFEPGLICKDKQYAENAVFEEPEAVVYSRGMHFCPNPLDVLDYYGFINGNGEMNEFADVEALDEAKTDDNKKYCTTKLKIGAKITLPEFIKAGIEFVMEKTKFDAANMPAASGYNSKLAASGYNSQLAASGYNSQLAASGDNSQLAASGDYSKLAASGYNSKLAASGDNSQLAASGYNSIVAGIGVDNIAKAKKGCWITLAEYEWSEELGAYKPVCVKTEQVDGERIKEDTWYKLKNGEFVEVEQ